MYLIIIEMQKMKPPDEIVRLIGGNSKTARALGVTPQAVSNWVRRGGVPLVYATAIIAAVRANGGEINYSDLLE